MKLIIIQLNNNMIDRLIKKKNDNLKWVLIMEWGRERRQLHLKLM